MNPAALRLYLVADPDHAAVPLVDAVEAAISGGVTMVQLRAKSLSDRDLLTLARRLREACARRSVPFILNDRLDIALAVGADGVHLGVDDLPVEVARRLAGREILIGFSPETDEQIERARTRGVSYLGIGPVYGTRTKADAGDQLGTRELTRRIAIGDLPAVGIGAIDVTNAGAVIRAGAAGVAIVSAILGAADPCHAAAELRFAIDLAQPETVTAR